MINQSIAYLNGFKDGMNSILPNAPLDGPDDYLMGYAMGSIERDYKNGILDIEIIKYLNLK